VLSHGNVMGCVGGVSKIFPIKDNDVHLSYLPLVVSASMATCALLLV